MGETTRGAVATMMTCPRCGLVNDAVTYRLRKPARFETCGHDDLSADLEVQRDARDNAR